MGAVYMQLSLGERRRIEDWWHARVPVREIARVLRRSKSTIHREIKRSFREDDAFPRKYAGHATQLQTNKRRSVQRKLIRHPDQCRTVIARIKQCWTPEQIGNRVIYEGAALRVCQETIYRYICSKEGMDRELWWYLPEQHKSRRARKRQGPKFDRDVSILFRPDYVAHRRQFGHWEVVFDVVQTEAWTVERHVAGRTRQSVHLAAEEPEQAHKASDGENHEGRPRTTPRRARFNHN